MLATEPRDLMLHILQPDHCMHIILTVEHCECTGSPGQEVKGEAARRITVTMTKSQHCLLLVNHSGFYRLKQYLPEQHSQQEEDEDPHQQTDGNDPAHHVTPGLLTVQRLKHQLQRDKVRSDKRRTHSFNKHEAKAHHNLKHSQLSHN